MRKLFKRVVTAALSISIALSSIGTVYADFNGTGGGSESSPSTLEDVGTIALYHVNQGFRMYLVSDHGLAVTNSVDFVKYRPWDIQAGYGQSVEQMKKMWEDYYNVVGMYKNTPKDKIAYLGGVKTDNVYFNIKGQINKDGATPTNKNGVNYLTRERQADSAVTNASGFYYSPGKMYTIGALETYLRNYISSDYGNFPLTGSPDKIELPDKFNINGGQPLITYNKIMAPIEFLYSTMGLVGTGEEMKNLMMAALNDNTDDTTILIQYLVNIKMPDVNGIGEPINGGALTPLFEFTDSTVKKKYQEIYSKATTDIERKQAMITTMREMNLKVAFEPVSWAIPVVLSSKLQPIIPNKWGYIWTSDRIVYGTPTNVVSYVLSELNTTYRAKYPESGMPPYSDYGNYISWLKNNDVKLGWQWNLTTEAYRTAKDIPEFNMKAYDPNEVGGSDLASLGGNLFTLGFGVMYFGVDVEQVISTPTWDSVTYPESSYTPGPAPDKSSMSTEGNDYKNQTYPDGKVKDKNFNIVKFYATKKPDGSYEYTENFTRQQTLHNIILDDEPGYKVDNWFTSPEFREPQSDSDSYEDFKNELINGEQKGTSAGRIEVKADSQDNTLYMRLVSVETPDPEPDFYNTIIPLYENEISKQLSLSSVIGTPYLSITNHLPSVPKDYNGSYHKEQYRAEGSDGWKAYYNYHNPSLTNADSELVAKPAPFEIKYSGLFSGNKLASRGKQVAVPQSMNSKFTLWRGMDKPTLASYKPEDSSNKKSELKTLGLPEANTPQSTRGKTNNSTDISGIIQKTFTSQFEVDDSNSKYNIETEYRTRDGYTKSCSNHSSGHWKWYSWTSWSHYSSENGTTNPTSLATLLTKIYYYLGKPNTGDKQATDNTGLSFKLNTKTIAGGLEANREFNGKGTAIPTSQAITLYPYTQMKYNTTQDSTWKNTYTLSHYISTIHNTDGSRFSL